MFGGGSQLKESEKGRNTYTWWSPSSKGWGGWSDRWGRNCTCHWTKVVRPVEELNKNPKCE